MSVAKRFPAFWPVVLAVVLCGCESMSARRVLKEHPELRRADGSKSKIEWTKHEGDEAIIFLGNLPEDESAGAGIYVGGNPEFKPPTEVKPIPGKLGAFDVEWYTLADKGSRFYRACVIDYQNAIVGRGGRRFTYTTRRHVWAYAHTEEGLNKVLAELDKLKMFAARPADLVM